MGKILQIPLLQTMLAVKVSPLKFTSQYIGVYRFFYTVYVHILEVCIFQRCHKFSISQLYFPGSPALGKFANFVLTPTQQHTTSHISTSGIVFSTYDMYIKPAMRS